MSRKRAITLIFSSCIFCARAIFACSSLRFSSLYSVKKSIISDADDFERRLFFLGGSLQLFRGDSSSSVDVSWPGKDETVAAGTILGSVPKNSPNSSSNSHSFLLFPVLLLWSLTFLYFSSSFFHLFEHCSPVTFVKDFPASLGLCFVF